jgi:predicted extracellular nuclease
VSQAGSNPFGLTQPAAKVVFQSGSLYRHEQTGLPGFSGRTYANFELNSAGYSSNSTGSAALSIDNLTITSGAIGLNLTGTFNLKGNVSVASGATLNFNPASAATVTLSGTSQQTISGLGTLTFGANETVALNNANGVLLQRDVTLGGPLALTAGDVTTGANILTLTSTSLTGAGEIVGNVKRLGPFTPGTNYPFNNANTLINFGSIAVDPGDITITLEKAAPAGLSNAIARKYTITPASIGTFSVSVQLGYLLSEVGALDESTLRPWKNISTIWTEQPGTVDTTNHFVTASGATSFSDWAIATSVSALPTPPTGVGAADPNPAIAGGTTLLTVAVTPGTNPATTSHSVTCDLSTIGGSATQTFYDDGTNGDVTSGDNTFSYSATVSGGTTAGAKSLTCTIGDNESRPGSASIGFNVIVILPIGTVQGVVNDTDNGTLSRSPYAPASGNGSGQTVYVQGVIYEKTLQAISNSTNTYKGFYIQNTSGTADGIANTSDGLFVFMSTNSTFSGYTPTVGDEIILSGTISEYYYMTELSSPTLVSVVRSGVVLDTELSPVVANPPVSLADANRYWERLESMRVQVPMNSIVLGGRNVFSPADAEIWVANPNSTIGLRIAPYTNRAFRDAHPLDDNYDETTWDGNGYRILMGSLGIKATAGDAQTLIDPARTFSTLTNAPVGGVNYTFNKYRIEISSQPTFSEGLDPAANNPPTAIADRSAEYSIVDYNLENLYDYRDNPFSGCDFAGNTGCSQVPPFTAPVNPPYDYVPASDAVYQTRLNDIALQIINDLHNPDILMVQEVENQDICTVTLGALDCGLTDNSDGKPDVLQELALKIAANGGPAYDAAFDRDSSDLRGIAPAFLYRTDRVQLASPVGDPVLGADPAIIYAGTTLPYATVPYNSDVSNPKTLNAVLPAGVTACECTWVFPRAPDVGLFRIYSTTVGVGNYSEVYLINNHFKSGPDSCVPHRTEQAKYNAALVDFIQTAKPGARVVIGGDLNVYPRPDDPFAPIGQPASSDQLGSLYAPGLGLTNLWDVLVVQAPESAYGYVYLGTAQTLDQMFINQPMLADLTQVRMAHINSDFPADYPTDVARGTSDHDPLMVVLSLDTVAPTVLSNVLADTSPTANANVKFTVTFSEPVTGVDVADFTPFASGVIGASVTNVSAVSPAIYTVTVNTGKGNGTLRLDTIASPSIQDLAGNALAGPYTSGAVYVVNKTLTVTSTGIRDGWILESSEYSNVGGTLNNIGPTFNLGDDAANKQYRAILSFNTTLPSGAVITKVTLKIKKQGLMGTDPFTTLGKLKVDIRNPFFGANAGLTISDFQAAADAIASTFGAPVSNWYSAVLNAVGRSYVNKIGITQFRLRFATDDNNNNVADYMRFFSGDYTNVNLRPTLVIEYYVP